MNIDFIIVKRLQLLWKKLYYNMLKYLDKYLDKYLLTIVFFVKV